MEKFNIICGKALILSIINAWTEVYLIFYRISQIGLLTRCQTFTYRDRETNNFIQHTISSLLKNNERIDIAILAFKYVCGLGTSLSLCS